MNWKLVPEEPTEEMLHAARFYKEGQHTLACAYRAMLAAAPQAPSQEPTFHEVVDELRAMDTPTTLPDPDTHYFDEDTGKDVPVDWKAEYIRSVDGHNLTLDELRIAAAQKAELERYKNVIEMVACGEVTNARPSWRDVVVMSTAHEAALHDQIAQLQAAARLALSILELCNQHGWMLADHENQMYEAIAALREALGEKKCSD